MTSELHRGRMDSPVGELLLVWRGGTCAEPAELCLLDFEQARAERLVRHHHGVELASLEESPVPRVIADALSSYFGGALDALARVPIWCGGTDFERTVWAALTTIPAGTTQTYGELAKSLGRPSASRAVGRANGANPLGVVVPCHRVIGASGALTGYAGGLERKAWLLAHEARAAESQRINVA